MSAFDSESSLATFVQGVIDRAPFGSLIRQLQGAVAQVQDVLDAVLDMRFAIGSDTLTFTAANLSAVKSVTHGLDNAPTVVFIQVAPALNAFLATAVTATSSTTFSVQGYTASGAAITATQNFYWLAIG